MNGIILALEVSGAIVSFLFSLFLFGCAMRFVRANFGSDGKWELSKWKLKHSILREHDEFCACLKCINAERKRWNTLPEFDKINKIADDQRKSPTELGIYD
jgi:hypothetical protein